MYKFALLEAVFWDHKEIVEILLNTPDIDVNQIQNAVFI